jgi:hypothetical protein
MASFDAYIAGLFHIMRYALDRPWQHLISLEDMVAAVKIGHACTSHALAVFDLLEQDNTMQIARIVAQWLKQEKVELVTCRDCQRKFRRFKKDDLQPALKILKEHEIIRELDVKYEKGRPSEIFKVNPYLF